MHLGFDPATGEREPEPEPAFVQKYDPTEEAWRRVVIAVEEQALLDFRVGVFVAGKVYGTDPVPDSRIKLLLHKLHNNLGHPNLEIFLRVLRHGSASAGGVPRTPHQDGHGGSAAMPLAPRNLAGAQRGPRQWRH